MPFTVSHAAAVLPIHWFTRHKLPLTALMVGSMAPDFGYFISHTMSRTITHSPRSVITFSLPVGLAVWLFYVAFLEKTTITLLPDRWHTRFAHTKAITAPLILRACIAIMLGAATHIVWDAFTHQRTFVTRAWTALTGPMPGFAWMPIYHFLHGLSSVIGMAILIVWLRHLHRQPARSLIRPYGVSERARIGALWFLAATTLAVGLSHWLPYAHGRYDLQFFYAAVGLSSGFFIAWCCIAFLMWFHARRSGSG